MIDKQPHHLEIKQTLDEKHGLCSAAETHWAIYLIQLINAQAVPPIHEGQTATGKRIKFLRKAEDQRAKDFSFGADSYFIISSEDPDLAKLIFVEEEPDVFVARPALPLAEALKINDFYDKDIQSRWKDCIQQFATQKGISPDQLTFSDLINQCLGQ